MVTTKFTIKFSRFIIINQIYIEVSYQQRSNHYGHFYKLGQNGNNEQGLGRNFSGEQSVRDK